MNIIVETHSITYVNYILFFRSFVCAFPIRSRWNCNYTMNSNQVDGMTCVMSNWKLIVSFWIRNTETYINSFHKPCILRRIIMNPDNNTWLNIVLVDRLIGSLSDWLTGWATKSQSKKCVYAELKVGQ